MKALGSGVRGPRLSAFATFLSRLAEHRFLGSVGGRLSITRQAFFFGSKCGLELSATLPSTTTGGPVVWIAAPASVAFIAHTFGNYCQIPSPTRCRLAPLLPFSHPPRYDSICAEPVGLVVQSLRYSISGIIVIRVHIFDCLESEGFSTRCSNRRAMLVLSGSNH